MVEQRSPKPRAESSILSAPAKPKRSPLHAVTFSVLQNKREPEARGTCRATPARADGGGYSGQGLAQRPKRCERERVSAV